MQRFQEETERSLGAWGFGSLFGDAPGRGGGIFSSFDRMFDDAFASMGNVANGQGGGQYFYESHTRTVGPDGQVHEEHVRTTPDENGNPRTSRTVRDGEERGSVWRGLRSPFEQDMPGMIGGRHHEDDVIVEELDCSDDEDERWGEYQGQLPRNRYERRDVDVMEEDDTRPSQRPGEWVRQRYNRWMNRA